MTDWLKRPLNKSLNAVAAKRATDAIELMGKSLPCHVTAVVSSGIVTVVVDVDTTPYTIPPITVPIQGSQWIKYPIQVGTKGLLQSADVRLGYQSGMGGGLPPIRQAPANLSALSFAFLGNTSWTTPVDPNALDLSGPHGIVAHDDANTNVLKVNGSGMNLGCTKFGIFGTSPVSKGTVTGNLTAVTDANAKLVIKSILNVLSAYGLLTDGTT